MIYKFCVESQYWSSSMLSSELGFIYMWKSKLDISLTNNRLHIIGIL